MAGIPEAIDYWHSLLRPEVERRPAFTTTFTERLRAARLSFGPRVHCPFLRPLFLDEAEVVRVRLVAETIARIGERVAAAALERPDLMDAVGLTEAERRLAAIDPGYGTASTASRLDAFSLPDSLQFAEYNAESPAGLGYTEVLIGVFEELEVLQRFRRRYTATPFRLMDQMLEALLASYREWGGSASPPTIAIVDWREVPTWSEFEILQERFIARGVPTVISDPRDLALDGDRLIACGRPIDLVYRRVLISDILDRPEDTATLVTAYETRRAAVANTFRCKIPHKKAFFAVLTDERFRALLSAGERETIRGHVPWTRLVREGPTTRDADAIDLVPYIRANRHDLVLKPNDEYGGTGVTLGWETDEAGWDDAIARALASPVGAWVVQEKITVRREPFARFDSGGEVTIGDMLVDLAPYLFRGRLAGFLTRLSASGLANVTSGGGQVPSFVVRERTA